MTIREKLLLEIAKNADFEGKDETEKALVAEIKAELKAAEGANSGADPDVASAAKELATGLVAMVKEMVSVQVKDAPIDRSAIKDDPNATTLDFDKEVKEAAGVQHVDIANEKDFKAFQKAFRFAEFAKALVRKDEQRAKALSTTDGEGGYLIPDEFRADLIQQMLLTDAIRKYATVIPMQGKLLEIPKLAADVKVYWGTENTSISTTSADFGNMSLTPFRLNAIIYASRELFDDSAISISDILRQRFVDRVADEENKVFIEGDGTTQPKGIDAETFRSIDAGNALTPDHITKAYWKLPKVYRATSRWLVNSRTMEHLENSKDDQGRYLYPSLQAEVPTLKGRPILVDDYVPSTKMFLGDLSFYYIGDRQQVSMEVSTEAGNTWEKHQVGLKVTERVDGEVALTQAFVEVTSTGVN